MNYKPDKSVLRGIDKPIKSESHLSEFFDKFGEIATLQGDKYTYQFKANGLNSVVKIEKLSDDSFNIVSKNEENDIKQKVISLSECRTLIWENRESINNAVNLARWEKIKNEEKS